MKLIAENRYDGFHQRNCGCQRRKKYQDEENGSDKTAKLHACEYLWKCDEHQSRTCTERRTVSAGEGEHSGDNHQTCEESNSCIKYFNLPY